MELIFQNNLEYFTFLTFRSFEILFFFDHGAKTMQALTILFGLVILLVTVCSYLCYYYQYGKLARYFLSNMYRFKSSYVLMTITFGVRPFLKGLVHAAFFEQWNLQIWFLIGIELTIISVIILFEIILDNHRSRLILLF